VRKFARSSVAWSSKGVYVVIFVHIQRLNPMVGQMGFSNDELVVEGSRRFKHTGSCYSKHASASSDSLFSCTCK